MGVGQDRDDGVPPQGVTGCMERPPAPESTPSQAMLPSPAVLPSPETPPRFEQTLAPSLFLVVLGGRVAKAHIELHDVRFVVGTTIEDTLPALRRQWFGARRGLHLDSWMRVQFVDGYRVELRSQPFTGPERLWFVNMGGYDPGQLAEQHAFGLFVAASPQAAKAAARRQLLPGALQRHKDDLHGVEAGLVSPERWLLDGPLAKARLGDGAQLDQPPVERSTPPGPDLDDCLAVQTCLALEEEPRLWLHLVPDGCRQPLVPDWYGYRPI